MQILLLGAGIVLYVLDDEEIVNKQKMVCCLMMRSVIIDEVGTVPPGKKKTGDTGHFKG